ncbi:MAG: hypothetical protein MUF83_02215 [Acidimicrobiales bacterium]|nr:hypothetical protein [Acidimicrobiales bacterium]
MSRPDALRALAAACAVVLGAAACSGDDGGDASTATTTTQPPETTTTTEVPLEQGTQVFVFEPSVGDCFDRRTLESTGPTDPADQIVLVLDCELPHSFEVFGLHDVPIPEVTTTTSPSTSTTTLRPGTSASSSTTTTENEDAEDEEDDDPDPWPGDDVLRDIGRLECPPLFEPYVGMAYELSTLEITYQLPDEESWPGARTIACLLFDPSGAKLVGSQQGVGV